MQKGRWFVSVSLLVVLIGCSQIGGESSGAESSTNPGESGQGIHGTVQLRTLLGGDLGEHATSVIEMDDGGFLIAGYDYDERDDIEEWDALVMRVDADGNQVWQKSSDRPGSEYAWVVRRLAEDEFVVVGTWETANGDTDGYMQAFDGDGNELWMRTYGGAGEEIFWGAEIAEDGGILAIGQTDSMGEGELDFYAVRTDAEGQELWSYAYGTEVRDRSFGIGFAPDGGALIAGFTGPDTSAMNLFFVRINADGRELWRRTIAGDRFDVAHDVLSLEDGGFMISGYTSSYGPGDHDGFLMRWTPDGRMLWMNTYGDSGDDRILHVTQLDDGGFAMIGFDQDIVVWRVDSDGNLVWSYRDNSPYPDVGRDIITASDGSIVVVGSNRSHNPPYEDVILLVLDDVGVP